jgi:hypothetical protein
MNAEQFGNVVAKLKELVSKATDDAALTAVSEAISIGKSQMTITVKMQTMGGEVSLKTKWATNASKRDSDELPEETVSNQPELPL